MRKISFDVRARVLVRRARFAKGEIGRDLVPIRFVDEHDANRRPEPPVIENADSTTTTQ